MSDNELIDCIIPGCRHRHIYDICAEHYDYITPKTRKHYQYARAQFETERSPFTESVLKEAFEILVREVEENSGNKSGASLLMDGLRGKTAHEIKKIEAEAG